MESYQSKRLPTVSASEGYRLSGRIDVVATDHAHLWPKNGDRASKPLQVFYRFLAFFAVMLEKSLQGEIPVETDYRTRIRTPARLFVSIAEEFIRPGYYADMVLVDPKKSYRYSRENILTKCCWSPFIGHTFSFTIDKTFVNGVVAFQSGQVEHVMPKNCVLLPAHKETCHKEERGDDRPPLFRYYLC